MSAKKQGKVVRLKAIYGKKSVRRTLMTLVKNLPTDYPAANKFVMIVESSSVPGGDTVQYGSVSNGCTRAEKLWLLEMGKRMVFKE